MGYNKASLDLMGAEDDDEMLDVVQLSNGRYIVITADDLEF